MKNIVDIFLEQGFLISPEFLTELNMDFDIESLLQNISEKFRDGKKPIVINNDIITLLSNTEIDLNWEEFEKAKVLFENGKDQEKYKKFLILNTLDKEQKIKQPFEDSARLKILRSYGEKSKKLEVNDFVSYFRARYNSLANILRNRLELRSATSINRLLNKTNGEVTVIGLISEKKVNKSGSIIVKLEDPTGCIDIFVNRDKKCYDLAKDIVLDEVIGLVGILKNGTIFTDDIYIPDTPAIKEVKKADKGLSAAFISDLHVGSKLFLEENFLKFIRWLNHEQEEQAKFAETVRYLFIIGDLVDGVGVYPEQEKELKIKDIREQYGYCAELLAKIRKDIKIIICAGQHDALRLSEPQAPLNKEFAPDLYNLPNVFLVSNPALVNIGSSENFEGFNVLIYHGASFHYFISNVESLRLNNNARDNPAVILRFLLQKRHLAPSHGSTLYFPNADADPLIIDKVPDIFVSGEMHRSSVLSYNNTIMINCSCWQAKTDFQERTGNNPDPCRVPIINLKTREVKIMDFS